MSSGKPVLVSEMYWPRARIRRGADDRGVPDLKEETSCSRRFWALERVGQLRMACLQDSCSVLQ